MNRNKYLVLILILLFGIKTYPQLKTENYQGNYNQISFNLILNSLKYHKITNPGNKITVSFDNYSDESRPGYYTLPSRNIYVALPAYSKVKVAITPIEENRIQGVPELNPVVMQLRDSTLEYSRPDKINIQSIVSTELFKIKGYLWIGDYYCVDIQLNQYRYNNADIINELKKIKIDISLLDQDLSLRKSRDASSGESSEIAKTLIVNYSNARPLNKSAYVNVNFNDDWINYNSTYLKIGVAADGVYRITPTDLQNYGIFPSLVDPRTFKLIVKGKEQPIYVSGENDGSFGTGDYIEFTGVRNMGGSNAQALNYRETSTGTEPYKEYLDRYSDTTIYWLTWGGSNGLRVDTVSSVAGIPSDTLKYYSEVAHYEANLYLDYSDPSIVTQQDPEWVPNETWVWGQQLLGSVDRPFTANNIYPGKSAQAYYKIQDYATDGYYGAHKVGLSINNDPTVYDSSAFDKYQQKVVKANFSSDLLNEGNNVLKTISFPTNTSLNSIEYDWYEVEYPRYLKTSNDSLKIFFDGVTTPGLKFVKITNLSSSDIVIYKYSPSVKKITNYTRTGDTIIFSDSVNNGDRYFVVAGANIKAPKYYYKKTFSNLRSSSLQADYILLTDPEFIQKANEYVNFISSNYNVTTKVINVNDIYDQFNYGFFAPEPIRYFLEAANLYWQSPKPAYLFIVGDATYDYYGNKTKYFGSPVTRNFVPSYGHPVSDNWFTMWGDTTGSLVQQMYVGRIPVNTVTEFDHYFDKHKKYLSDPYDRFNKTYLLFSSGASDGEIQALKTTNDDVENNLIKPAPVGGIAHHLYKTFNPPSNFGPFTDQQVAQYIGDGALFISYIGHSGTQIWDNGISTIEQLKNNSGKGTLISDWGCSTAKFAEPDIKSFSELFINEPDGQAIGYTGNTSLGFVSTAMTFPQYFYGEMLQKNITGLGEAETGSRSEYLQTYGSTGIYRIFALTNTLLGDPIIKLKIPQQPNLSISTSDLSLQLSGTSSQAGIDDSQDSVLFKAGYYNLGRVDTTTFVIRVTDNLNGKEILNKIFTKNLPLYNDSVSVYIPTKNLPGNHQVTVTLDDANQVGEITKADNTANLNINVSSSSVRALLPSANNTTSNGEIKFLNPITRSSADSLIVEYADNPGFINYVTLSKALDTLVTTVSIPGLTAGKRYWLRGKLNSAGSNNSNTISFVYDPVNSYNYSLSDSVSFNGLQNSNLKYGLSGLQLQPNRNELKLQSAGFYAGNFAIVQLNGVDYITSSNLGGQHIAVFDAKTLKFEYEKLLNWYNDPNNFESDYLTLLDTIPDNKIIAISASDDPSGGMTTTLRNKLKSIGSTLIDSVQFRNSWGIITQKNYTPGKVLEGWHKSYDGPVTLDTVITLENSSGNFLTGEIGPAAKWQNLNIAAQLPGNSGLILKTIGIKQDKSADTLSTVNLNGNSIDLSGYSAKTYPYLKFYFQLSSTDSTALPSINLVDVSYEGNPELGTNYQLVSLDKDTVSIGENIKLGFTVMNIGESPADSFNVKVEVVHNDNSRTEIMNEPVPVLNNGTGKLFSINYNAGAPLGASYFFISIDPGNKIQETFKDNNFYQAQFYVKGDTNKPSIAVKFDGQDIVDNDFVSSHPKISIELNDPSYVPVTDTSGISLKLNGQPVYYAGNSPVLSYKFNSVNPKMVVEYKPALNDGEYSLTVNAENGLGNKAVDLKRSFVVSGTPKILNLYNYPNPFRSDTYITFKLTQIPDGLKIKIFTVAGRLIKEFNLRPSDLNYDFNRVYWDGKDEDGDLVANGVYLYRVIMTAGGRVQSLTQKMALVR